MSNEYDYLFKLLLIGDSGVGKVRLPQTTVASDELSVFKFSRVSSCGSPRILTRKAISAR